MLVSLQEKSHNRDVIFATKKKDMNKHWGGLNESGPHRFIYLDALGVSNMAPDQIMTLFTL